MRAVFLYAYTWLDFKRSQKLWSAFFQQILLSRTNWTYSNEVVSCTFGRNTMKHMFMYMPVILSRLQNLKLPCVTPLKGVSLHRQVCHHSLPRRLSLWQPPAGPGVTSLPAYWHLGLGKPNCNECPIFFYRHTILYMYCYSYFMSLNVMSCDYVYWIRYFLDLGGKYITTTTTLYVCVNTKIPSAITCW